MYWEANANQRCYVASVAKYTDVYGLDAFMVTSSRAKILWDHQGQRNLQPFLIIDEATEFVHSADIHAAAMIGVAWY
jgi:hypothetical protein